MNRVKLQLELNQVELDVVRAALWQYAYCEDDERTRSIVLSVRDVLQCQFNKNSVVRTKPLNVLYIKE